MGFGVGMEKQRREGRRGEREGERERNTHSRRGSLRGHQIMTVSAPDSTDLSNQPFP